MEIFNIFVMQGVFVVDSIQQVAGFNRDGLKQTDRRARPELYFLLAWLTFSAICTKSSSRLIHFLLFNRLKTLAPISPVLLHGCVCSAGMD